MPTRRQFLHAAMASLAGGAWLTSPALARPRGSNDRIHVVQRGDTLDGIARRYGVTIALLRARNRLSGSTILVGQKLTVPGGAARPAVPEIPDALVPVVAATRSLSIEAKRWKYIVAHHSGIEDGNATSYGREHRRRGYENGLAYHFVIGNGRDSGEGEIEIGSRWLRQVQGGHVRNEAYNEHGIGICLVGNFEKRIVSSRQLASFISLVDWLRTGAPLGIKPTFTVHRWVDRNHTVCPGKYFPYIAMSRRYRA